MQLLEIESSYWALFFLSIISALINVFIFAYVAFYLPLNRTNKKFSLFLLLIAFIQIIDGCMRISNTANNTLQLVRAGTGLYLFMCPVGLLFALRFSSLHKKISESATFCLLFVPAIFLEILTAAHLDQYAVKKSFLWNWVADPKTDLITSMVYGWIVLTASLLLTFLWLHYFKETNSVKKKQALLLAMGFSFPYLAGVIAEVIFPMLLKLDSIPLSTPVMSIFSICSIIAIRKYQMFDYSPRHQWNTIIENMNEGVLIVDTNDKIMYANKKFCQLTEYKFEEISGKIASDLFLECPEHKEILQTAIKERARNKSGQYEIPIKTKSGKTTWILISGSPYLDKRGKIIGSIAIQTNIDYLKQLELELYNNNLRLNRAQNIAHVGCWELDFATGKVIWSEEALRIYGVPVDNKEQSYDSWLSFIPLEDRDRVLRLIEISQADMSDSSFEHRILRKDGTIRHIHSISTYEFDKNGKAIGLLGTCHDITERVLIQNKLEKSEMQVRHFARHLTNTLENERAFFAREIHDELGQYLTGIKLGLSSLQNQIVGNAKLNTRIESMISDIVTGQQAVRKIATQLRPGILDTLGLTQSINWLVKEFEKKTDMRFYLEIDDKLECTYEQQVSTCIFRICQEALTNISKHAEASEVSIKLYKCNNTLTLLVSDNGKGIANSNLENPFSMGLLGMKERASLIGASLNISSISAKGTTIQLELKQPT